MKSENKILDKKQLMELYNLSRSRIQYLMANENLPHIKTRNKVYYSMNEVTAFMRSLGYYTADELKSLLK